MLSVQWRSDGVAEGADRRRRQSGGGGKNEG